MIYKAIVHQLQLRVAFQNLACKVALEKAVVMTTIRNRNRRRFIILRNQQPARGGCDKIIVDLRQCIRVYMYQYTFYEYKIRARGG